MLYKQNRQFDPNQDPMRSGDEACLSSDRHLYDDHDNQIVSVIEKSEDRELLNQFLKREVHDPKN